MGRDAGQGQGHMGRGTDMTTPGSAGSPATMGQPGTSASGMRGTGQPMNAAMQGMAPERGARQGEMAAEDRGIAGARAREIHR